MEKARFISWTVAGQIVEMCKAPHAQLLKNVMNGFTGVISKRDFYKAMESHKHYSQSETDFLLSCAETDENEVLDYKEFVERFHEPAKVSAIFYSKKGFCKISSRVEYLIVKR